jgi:hypothetical protein
MKLKILLLGIFLFVNAVQSAPTKTLNFQLENVKEDNLTVSLIIFI